MAENWRAPDPGQQQTPGVQPGSQQQIQNPVAQQQPPASLRVPLSPPPPYRPRSALLPALLMASAPTSEGNLVFERPECQYHMRVPHPPQPPTPLLAQSSWLDHIPTQPPPQSPPQVPAPPTEQLQPRGMWGMSPTSTCRWMAEHTAEEVARAIFFGTINAPDPSDAVAGPSRATAPNKTPGSITQPGTSRQGYPPGRTGTAPAASQQEEPSSTQGVYTWQQRLAGIILPPLSSSEDSTSSDDTGDHFANHPYSPTTPPEPRPVNRPYSPITPPGPGPANPPHPPNNPSGGGGWVEPTPQKVRPISPGSLASLHYGYGVQLWEIEHFLSLLPEGGVPITEPQQEAAARLRDLLHVVPQGLFRCIMNHFPPEQRKKIRRIRQKTYQIRKGENKLQLQDHRARMEVEACGLRRQAAQAALREESLRKEITDLRLQLSLCKNQLMEMQNKYMAMQKRVAFYRRLRGSGMAADVAGGQFQDNESG